MQQHLCDATQKFPCDCGAEQTKGRHLLSRSAVPRHPCPDSELFIFLIPPQVWDGTRCPHALLKVAINPNVTEGRCHFPKEKEDLIANVFVYDNHVELAGQLKVRARRRRKPELEQEKSLHHSLVF